MSLTAMKALLTIAITYAIVAIDVKGLAALGPSSLGAATFSGLQKELLDRRPDMEHFRSPGPFAVEMQRDLDLRLSLREVVKSDFFLAGHGEKAPLAIIQHGYDSLKADHTNQAMHLASWGIHSLCLQLPNKGPWITTGKSLARVVQLLHRRPQLIDTRIDVNKMILIGHSFGGVAAAVALAEKAPAPGAILLDPATINRETPGYLRRVTKPVLILGADERISPARNRETFYRSLRGGVSEISIKNAYHEDAQFPSRFSEATEDLQMTFATALTSATFSLAATGKFDFAWQGYGEALKTGKLFNAKKK